MSNKIQVDQDLCIGCGACINLCPSIFELDDSGKSQVIGEGNCESCDCDCGMIVDSCPVGAIKATE
ncbi:MAG: ferredoxin [Candidatus Pacebacteria bacterium]|nr:ferredoxin [Candidatus Paceibacterota bacterium]